MTKDTTVEQKIGQLRELFADAPEVGKKALADARRRSKNLRAEIWKATRSRKLLVIAVTQQCMITWPGPVLASPGGGQ